jgi:hypothetical protein
MVIKVFVSHIIIFLSLHQKGFFGGSNKSIFFEDFVRLLKISSNKRKSAKKF